MAGLLSISLKYEIQGINSQRTMLLDIPRVQHFQSINDYINEIKYKILFLEKNAFEIHLDNLGDVALSLPIEGYAIPLNLSPPKPSCPGIKP